MAEKERLNLHDVLSKKSYAHAVICTYAFDPVFFEDYCLNQFDSLRDNANVTVVIDKKTYDQIITAPEEDRPKQANLRYLLHPVTARRTFHPKIYFFAEKNRGRFVIGSANLTRPGLGSNAELVACYDYVAEEEERFRYIFRDVFVFLKELESRWPNTNLRANLHEIEVDVPWLLEDGSAPTTEPIEFTHNLNESLWKQLFPSANAPIEQVWILSRYFDSSPGLLTQLIKQFSPKRIKIFTQNSITRLTEEWLKHESVRSGQTEIWLADYGEDEATQNLHAKAFAIETQEECRFAFGSANFTWAALFHDAAKGNVETLMITPWLSKKKTSLSRFFDPSKKAVLLKDPSKLISAQVIEGEEPKSEERLILLLEANCENDKLFFHIKWREETLFDELRAVIHLSEEEHKLSALSSAGDGWYHAKISQDILHRFNQESTSVMLEAIHDGQCVATSNRLLVANLLDIQSGQTSKQQRYIKQAENSLSQFLSIFDELFRQNNDEMIRTFLAYCNIPVDFSERLTPRLDRAMWTANHGMRNLGEKNIKIFHDLHELSIEFVDRHMRKLRRHIKSYRLSGIDNFFYIFFAAGYILRMQCERALTGLEFKKEPLLPEEWAKWRNYFDIYFAHFEELMGAFDDYMKILSREPKRAKVIPRIKERKESILKFCNMMLAFQSKLESLRFSTLKMKTTDGKHREPHYNDSNIFNPDYWPSFCEDIQEKLARIEIFK